MKKVSHVIIRLAASRHPYVLYLPTPTLFHTLRSRHPMEISIEFKLSYRTSDTAAVLAAATQ